MTFCIISIIQKAAERVGLQQVLWLYGQDHQMTEVGTMNIFVFLKNHKGGIINIKLLFDILYLQFNVQSPVIL